MTLTSSVTLYPSRRVGGLRQAANPLPNGWERGLTVGTSQCARPIRIGPCDQGEDSPQHKNEPHRFNPAVVRLILECSTLSRGNLAEYANRSADVTLEYALALELFDGAATENPNLGDAQEVAANLTMVEAIACLEAVAAEGLTGRIAFLHVPQGLAIYLPDNVQRDASGQLRTPAGNVVVVSPGYSGTSIYATGEVWVATNHYDTVEYVDRAVDTDQVWADSLALAVFDPCFLYSADTEYTVCVLPDPESPGESP